MKNKKSKLKTHKGAAKRFKVTGSGKLTHRRAGRRHLMTVKSPKRTRTLRKPMVVSKTMEAQIRRLLPYS